MLSTIWAKTVVYNMASAQMSLCKYIRTKMFGRNFKIISGTIFLLIPDILGKTEFYAWI